jgi:hypothetical protein
MNTVQNEGFTPVTPAFGNKALASVILSEKFKSSLASMLADFSQLEPNQITSEGYEFVGLSEKKALFEKHFPFFEMKVDSHFVSLSENSAVMTCESTLYVLTDEGYVAWFSRLGQSSGDSVGADGREADAETSALRRIFMALGMGKEGAKEVDSDSANNATAIVGDYCKERGIDIKTLLKEYRSHHSAYDLAELKEDYLDLGTSTKKEIDVKSEDWVLLAKFVSHKRDN